MHNYSWYFTYLLTLFLFDISPGVSFVATANNTIKNRSLISGTFTALGIATSDGISAIIGFFFCSVLDNHAAAFKVARLMGMMILFYFAFRMLLASPKQFSIENQDQSKTNWLSYKSGFLLTFSNIGIATIIISVISQFYQHINGVLEYSLLLLTIPAVSFLSFFTVACCVFCLKLWKLFSHYAWIIDKIAGFILIWFGVLGVIDIIHG